jgi:hypothetical protein
LYAKVKSVLFILHTKQAWKKKIYVSTGAYFSMSGKRRTAANERRDEKW